jgi:hypothetical protein
MLGLRSPLFALQDENGSWMGANGEKLTLRALISRLLFRFSRTAPGGFVVGMTFPHFAWLLPMRRLRETQSIICFDHPFTPDSPHVVLVPKYRVPTLDKMLATDRGTTELLPSILSAAAAIAASNSLLSEHG